MKRWCLRIIILLVVLAGVAFAFANSLVQRYVDNQRSYLEARASQELGAQIEIAELDAELRPFPQLHARSVTISWPESGREPINVGDLIVRIRFVPLLSGNLDLNYIKLSIPRYRLPGKNVERALHDTVLQARLMIEGKHITLKNVLLQTRLEALPFELSAPQAYYDGEIIDVDRVDVKSGSSHFDIEGKYALSTGAFDLKAAELLIKPDVSRELLQTWNPKPQLQLGELRGTFLAHAENREQAEVQADLSATKLVRGKGVSADALALKKVRMTIRPGGVVKVNGDLRGDVIKIVDEKTTYSAAKLDGTLEYEREAGGSSRVNGKITLDQFGYADGRTTVSEVVAKIEPAQFAMKASGDMSLALNVQGSALKLNHDSITISRTSSMSGPISISIPAKGGYSVSGPVSVKGADIQTARQDLRGVQGTVQMTISPKEKSFVSKGLQFQAQGKSSRLAGDFRMNDGKFSLASAETDFLGGMLRCSGELSRTGPRPLKLEARAEQLSVQRIRDAIVPEKEGKAFGTVETAQMTLTGNFENFSATVGGGGNVRIMQQDAEKALISRMLFKALSAVPIVSDILGADKDLGTRQVLEATVKFRNGAAWLEPAKLSREGSYTVSATGMIGFDKRLELKGNVVFLQETLSDLALGIGPLKKILNRVAKIVVPIRASGIAPDIDVRADLNEFLRNNSGLALGQDIISQIGDVLLPGRKAPGPTGNP